MFSLQKLLFFIEKNFFVNLERLNTLGGHIFVNLERLNALLKRTFLSIWSVLMHRKNGCYGRC